jgi:hypothetical protein
VVWLARGFSSYEISAALGRAGLRTAGRELRTDSGDVIPEGSFSNKPLRYAPPPKVPSSATCPPSYHLQ